MAWRDTLVELRNELTQMRAERQQQAADAAAGLRKIREELSQTGDVLGISELLSEMNATLLEGKGAVETIVSWDADREGPDGDEKNLEFEPEDDPDDEDVITTVLTWEEDGEREIAVEVVSTEQGSALQVNGVVIRLERDALEQALVDAFRDELEV